MATWIHDGNSPFLSERGIPLVYHGVVDSDPVLTCENYLKWYSLYLIRLNDQGQIEISDEILDGEIWINHIPIPAEVHRICEERGWYLCEESLEMLIGRWVLHGRGCDVESFTRQGSVIASPTYITRPPRASGM